MQSAPSPNRRWVVRSRWPITPEIKIHRMEVALNRSWYQRLPFDVQAAIVPISPFGVGWCGVGSGWWRPLYLLV